MFVILVFIGFIVLPTIFWVAVIRRFDSDNPEPPRLLALVFFMGICAVAVSIFAEMPLLGTAPSISDDAFQDAAPTLMAILTAFLAGPIEESMKLFLWMEVAYDRPNFDQLRDGVIFALMCALGFSFLENIMYLVMALRQGSDASFVLIGLTRAVVSTLIHVGAGAIAGYFVGISKLYPERRMKIVFLGLLLAALFHGLSNVFIISVPHVAVFVDPIASIVVLSYVIHLSRKPQNVEVHDFARA